MIVPIDKLDPCFQPFPQEAEYSIEWVDARTLMDYRRFDLMAKWVYIDHYIRRLDMTWATELYSAQVSAITGNTNAEKGNDKKQSISEFLSVFRNLIEDIKHNGFDESKSYIPVDAAGYMIDGAHRVTCAAYFNKPVKILRFKDWKVNYKTDYKFLLGYKLSEKYLDYMALTYSLCHENIYMLCLWSQTRKQLNKYPELIKLVENKTNIVYIKKTPLNSKALRNLCMQIYGHTNWIGNIQNHFSGVDAKVNEILDSHHDIVEFWLLEANAYEDVFQLKQEIRQLYNIGLSSVHTTDNAKETRQITDLIYNPNSLLHLRKATPDRYEHSFKLVQQYKDLLAENGIEKLHYIVDSSIVMAIYGIREAGDLDYLTDEPEHSEIIKQESAALIEDHRDYMEYHNLQIQDMLYNANNYFVFNELKFLIPGEIIKFKLNKGELKDKRDVDLMNAFFKQGLFSKIKMALSSLKYAWSINPTKHKLIRLPGRIVRKLKKMLTFYR